jgi:hypothetical protein
VANTAPHQARVRHALALVGTGRLNGTLADTGTTAALVRDTAANCTPSALGAIASAHGIPPDAVALIKVDTDGCDADVLTSGLDIIEASRPVLFWEAEVASGQALDELMNLLVPLDRLGYRYAAFDNFGGVLVSECGSETITDLGKYLAAKDRTPTFAYIDVCAAVDGNRDTVRAAIEAHRT